MSLSIEPPKNSVRRMADAVDRWARECGIAPARLPCLDQLRESFGDLPDPCRPPVPPSLLADWENRHGFPLPHSLRAWLSVSDGFYLDGPVVHRLSAIGPMVPFARMAGLHVQPESWFELGNPTETETVCVDLAYRWSNGDFPLFTSGDDQLGIVPRLISPGFAEWFLRLLHQGGRPFWLDPGYPTLGDPWEEHRRRTPPPEIPDRLRSLLEKARPLIRAGVDERLIADRLNVTCIEAESLVRYVQHQPAEVQRPSP